ncbi:MAG: hypothetical protein GYA56_09005 [Geobacteraceae bacterium]|nr:hypothetical protein [Geobacteraceae bacterium]
MSTTQRRFTRLPIQSNVFIRSKERAFAASSLNLSIRGMFVLTRETVPVGEKVEVDLTIPSASLCPHIYLRGVVTRAENSGIALEFEGMDPDVFLALKNVLHKRAHHRLKPYMGP